MPPPTLVVRGLFLPPPPLGHRSHASKNAPTACLTHKPLPVSGNPTPDADVRGCRTASSISSPAPALAPTRSRAGRYSHTSHSATAVPRTRCPDTGPCHPCSPTRLPTTTVP